MPSTSDLREFLASDAEHSPRTWFPVDRVIVRGRRARLRRRVVTVTGAFAVSGAIALPIALNQGATAVPEPSGGKIIAPADSAPAIPPAGGWVSDLPEVDLPLGAPLTTPYASGSTLVVAGTAHDLGAQIREVLTVPEGTVVITGGPAAGSVPTQLEIVRPDGSTAVIDSGDIWSVHAMTDPGGATSLTWLWRAAQDDVVGELRSVAFGGGPISSVAGRFNLVLGSVDGAVLVTTVESERAVPDLARWTPGTDAVVPVASDPGDSSFVLDLAGPGVALMYGGRVPQCTYAAPVTDLGDRLWEQCDGGALVPSPDANLAANQVGVVDLATGEFVTRFDLHTDNLFAWDQFEMGADGTRADVAGWAGGDVLFRLSTTDGIATTPAPGGAVTYTPAYVGVRCSASTGACERLPHPIDAVEGGVY